MFDRSLEYLVTKEAESMDKGKYMSQNERRRKGLGTLGFGTDRW